MTCVGPFAGSNSAAAVLTAVEGYPATAPPPLFAVRLFGRHVEGLGDTAQAEATFNTRFRPPYPPSPWASGSPMAI